MVASMEKMKQLQGYTKIHFSKSCKSFGVGFKGRCAGVDHILLKLRPWHARTKKFSGKQMRAWLRKGFAEDIEGPEGCMGNGEEISSKLTGSICEEFFDVFCESFP